MDSWDQWTFLSHPPRWKSMAGKLRGMIWRVICDKMDGSQNGWFMMKHPYFLMDDGSTGYRFFLKHPYGRVKIASLQIFWLYSNQRLEDSVG